MVSRALLVGCNYPGTGSQLNGCVNDVAGMRELVMKYYGFEDDNIIIMIDTDKRFKQPTGKEIKIQLAEMIAKTGSNDVAIFHFSGHGTQIPTLDPKETDGKDEAICPTDMNCITDNELQRIVAPCRGKFTMVADCCHSGTMLDHETIVISGPKAGAPPPPDIGASAVNLLLNILGAGDSRNRFIKNRSLPFSQVVANFIKRVRILFKGKNKDEVARAADDMFGSDSPMLLFLKALPDFLSKISEVTGGAGGAGGLLTALANISNGDAEENPLINIIQSVACAGAQGGGVGLARLKKLLPLLGKLVNKAKEELVKLENAAKNNPGMPPIKVPARMLVIGVGLVIAIKHPWKTAAIVGSLGALLLQSSHMANNQNAQGGGGATGGALIGNIQNAMGDLHIEDLAHATHAPPVVEIPKDVGILISGCQDNETSADYCPGGDKSKAHGALTNAIRTVVLQHHEQYPGMHLTYRNLVLVVRDLLTKTGFSQSPCLECDESYADTPFIMVQ